jgi:hypothetical protein
MLRIKELRLSDLLLLGGLLGCTLPAFGEEAKHIEDNSFLIEEAYNQEDGVVQFIQTFQRSSKTREWFYSLTHEMPFPSRTHQLSYTIPVARVAAGRYETGLGDIAVNYRYQLVDADGLAFAPRISLILPTGDYKKSLGNDAAGYQFNLPLSVAVTDRWVSHWNLGATYTPRAREASGVRADTHGYNVGASIVYLYSKTFNFMVEAVRNENQAVQPEGSRQWERTAYLNPGFRYALNYESGLQVVLGLSAPIGIGPSRHDNGVFAYLSLEK